MNLRKIGAGFLDGFAEELQSNRRVWLVLFGIFYFVSVLPHALRLFWYDELFTYYVASLPSLGDVWRALTRGADQNPPLFYVLTRAATSVFGSSELAFRVPAILGFLVLCCCLYTFVARRAGACYGFAAMLLPMITGAFRYAFEARAYGLVLGFCGLSLVSWQRATETTSRAIPLACLTLSLTAALATHCYAVLILAPFGIAQIVRDHSRRKLDWVMWACITLPLGACISYLPLLATISTTAFDNPVFRPSWQSAIGFFQYLMVPALWPLFIAALLIAFGAARCTQYRGKSPWNPEEIVLAASFLLIPILALLLAKISTHIFMFRYGLTAVIAIAIVFPMIAAMLTNRSPRVGAALPLLIGGWFAATFISQIVSGLSAVPESPILFDQRSEVPIVISSGLMFYEMNHYASSPRAARIWYLTDAQASYRLTGTDVFEKGFPLLNSMFPFRAHLEDYHAFLADHPHFEMYGYATNPLDWLTTQLLHDGAQLTFLGQHSEEFGQAVFYDVYTSAGRGLSRQPSDGISVQVPVQSADSPGTRTRRSGR